MIEHSFTGPPFTVGIEEELMLCDAQTMALAPGIEDILAGVPPEYAGEVKPELFQSVLEIATRPCGTVDDAITELTGLRRLVAEVAERKGMVVAAAGTHPFGDAREEPITERGRYQELARELGYLVRHELIFGTHIHVAIEGADKAVYVADGIRRYIPLLLGLSCNSPFWKGEDTGMRSTRISQFRSFPRVGVPPHYGTWDLFEERVQTMVNAGAIPDYTYLWWDVRPHPNFGTVEIRVCDQQTRVEETRALTALVQSVAHGLAMQFDRGGPLVEAPTELIDDNKVRAGLQGIDTMLVDFRAGTKVSVREWADRLIETVTPDADVLGCREALESLRDVISADTGAVRQHKAFAEHGDLVELVRGLAAETVP